MQISFNKQGYDPFIDFIKAYAIICVLFGHTFPKLNLLGYGLWAGMQVPLFILVQVFHFFKKERPLLDIRKVLLRVFIPFIFVEFLLFVVLLGVFHINHTELVTRFLHSGGLGPGSYYPWIYLQVALILPFFFKWMQKRSKLQLAIVFLLICEALEFVAALIDFPDWIYRLFLFRYLFLFYLAWIWVKDGIVINRTTVILSLISFTSIIYFEYFSINDEPFFYNTVWKFHRWPCYYYVAILGTFMLNCIFKTISKYPQMRRAIKMLARCSYEIFLVQMFVCQVFPSLSCISEGFLRTALKIFLIFAISIIGGYYFNRYYNSIVLKKI